MALPSDVSNLVGWWKADSLALANGASVPTWTDNSATGASLTQATGATQPTYQTNVLNGFPVLRFNGSQYLENATFSFVQPTTMFVVSKYTTAGTSPTLIGAASANQNAIFYDASNFTNAYAGISLTGNTSVLGSFIITTAQFNTASSLLHVNGTQQASGNAGSSNMTSLRVGNNSSGNTIIGDVAELVIYNRVLTTAERASIDTYLSNKYGIAVTDYVSTSFIWPQRRRPRRRRFQQPLFPTADNTVNASVSQVAATVTATGGTQVVSSSQNGAVTQVAATVTVTGGTQTISTVNNVTVSQVAATVTATGGTQSVLSVSSASITQVAATVTASGGTQTIAAVNNVAISQLAATVTATGGTQAVDTVNNVSISQVAGTITATGGTQTVVTPVSAAISQLAATVTASGGTQSITAVSSSSITQVAGTVTATGGSQVITTSTGPLPPVSSASVIFLTDGRIAVRLTNNTYMPL